MNLKKDILMIHPIVTIPMIPKFNKTEEAINGRQCCHGAVDMIDMQYDTEMDPDHDWLMQDVTWFATLITD